MPETFCFQANRESEEKAPTDISINRGRRMNPTIQMLASYPPSGKEKGYEAQPSGGVICSLFVSQYWHSHF